MKNENSTEVTESHPCWSDPVSKYSAPWQFALVLIFYLIILPGNFLIILTIRSDPGLTAPLYFFLSNLAFLDASYSFTPQDAGDFLSDKKVISYRGCNTSSFFLHFLRRGGITPCRMAFDRYIAICRPLHYSDCHEP